MVQHNGFDPTACITVQLQRDRRALALENPEASVNHGTQEVLPGKAALRFGASDGKHVVERNKIFGTDVLNRR